MANKRKKDGYTALPSGKSVKVSEVPNWYKGYQKNLNEYQKENYKTFLLKFNKEADEKYIKLLGEQDNKVEFIRELLDKELKKRGK